MINYQLIERYVILVIALEFMTMGIIFTIHGNLGITPISCPVYILSLGFKPTLGEFTIAMHVLFVLFQIILLRANFELIQLLQVPLGIIFGVLIDINNYILGSYYPVHYFSKLIFIVLGSFFCSIGVSIEVTVKTVLIAGEGLLVAIIKVFNLPLDKTKIGFDISLVIISIIISIYLFQEIKGVREGTVIAAFLVGFFTGYVKPVIGPRILKFLYRNNMKNIDEKEFNNNLFIENKDTNFDNNNNYLEKDKLNNILINN